MVNDITREQVVRLLSYNPVSGVFTWLVDRTNGTKSGDTAGRLLRGYVRICVLGRSYAAHRLAWLVCYGTWPSQQINHKNGCKSDNRLSNLEEVSAAANTAHAYATGLISRTGERNGRARLVTADVLTIRASDAAPKELAVRFGVSTAFVREIRQRRRWVHI